MGSVGRSTVRKWRGCPRIWIGFSTRGASRCAASRNPGRKRSGAPAQRWAEKLHAPEPPAKAGPTPGGHGRGAAGPAPPRIHHLADGRWRWRPRRASIARRRPVPHPYNGIGQQQESGMCANVSSAPSIPAPATPTPATPAPGTGKSLTAGLVLAFLGSIAFSGKAIIVKLAYRHGVDAVTLIMYRMLFALPIFAAMAWWAGR